MEEEKRRGEGGVIRMSLQEEGIVVVDSEVRLR